MGNSQAYAVTYDALMKDVVNLLDNHPSGAGSSGRPPGDTGPLLRSTIVLLHTAWENYVETVALEATDFLLSSIADDHARLHHALRRKLGERKDPWALAGDAWKVEARNAVQGAAGSLNTPDVLNTEQLIDLAIGLPAVMHDLKWKGRARDSAISELNSFVLDVRGEIVHKGTTPSALDKNGVRHWVTFVEGLVPRMDARIAEHLAARLGAAPW